MRRVGLALASEGSPRHVTAAPHPERPERVRWIVEHLEKSGLMDSLKRVEVRSAEIRWIEEIHDPAYVRRVEEACRKGERLLDSTDTEISGGSYGAALHAAGAAIGLCDAVMAKEIDAGFSVLRPPGHHAERAEAMGFCLFNNVAVAARYMQKRHGLRRILIVDWDVHHGNGTQHAFESDRDVFYFSTHQYPHYPGTGGASERGKGAGEGATLNVPMPAGAGDAEYRKAFEWHLVPAARTFRPEAVLISAGFDAHREDPLGDIRLSDGMYAEMTSIILDIASESGAVGIVSLLEGGYHPEAMPRAAEAHLRALLQA